MSGDERKNKEVATVPFHVEPVGDVGTAESPQASRGTGKALFHVEQLDSPGASNSPCVRGGSGEATFHQEQGDSPGAIDSPRVGTGPGEVPFHVEQDGVDTREDTPRGADLVRAALAQARARAAEKGVAPGVPRKRKLVRRDLRSGAGKDARDPVLFGDAIRRMIEERGWQETTTNARVLEQWDQLVGPELAEHCRPASLIDKELVLVAESSAWATQLRLLAGQVLRTLREQVGPGVVDRIVVRGPAQPDWRKGPRRVQGRGPRDTYG